MSPCPLNDLVLAPCRRPQPWSYPLGQGWVAWSVSGRWWLGRGRAAWMACAVHGVCTGPRLCQAPGLCGEQKGRWGSVALGIPSQRGQRGSPWVGATLWGRLLSLPSFSLPGRFFFPSFLLFSSLLSFLSFQYPVSPPLFF